METPGERSQRSPRVVLHDDESQRRSMTPTDCDDARAHTPGGDDDAPRRTPPREPLPTAMPNKRGRPAGHKSAKEEQWQRMAREQVAKATQRVTADMASANFKKAQVLEDQAALQIFTMPESQVLSEQAREYLQLRRDEELIKIRLRVAERKAALEREEAATRRADAALARERALREEEVAAANARRTPAPPAPPPPATTALPPRTASAPSGTSPLPSPAPDQPRRAQSDDVAAGESQSYLDGDDFFADLQ
jgi:hypothetical protein